MRINPLVRLALPAQKPRPLSFGQRCGDESEIYRQAHNDEVSQQLFEKLRGTERPEYGESADDAAYRESARRDAFEKAARDYKPPNENWGCR